jgi:hypothetical protein
MLCAGAAYGQAGGIGLYFDTPVYATCDYADVAPALVPVYVVHKLTPGATASQFMVISGGGFNCTYTGEIIHVPVSIGSTQTGISVSYGGCVPSDILIATINYFCMGTAPVCSYLEVVPDPAAPTGTIEVVDCAFVKLIGNGGRADINSDGSCHCGNPTTDTTWGAVKTLYQ